MKVTVIGPNLRDQSKGSFHVHAAGCLDVARDPKRYGYDPDLCWDMEAGSYGDVIATVYGDFLDEGSAPADFANDFHWAPCVKGGLLETTDVTGGAEA